ncbi:MAG: 2-hydroxyacid dehydrogenase [Fibrobacterota bacterium]
MKHKVAFFDTKPYDKTYFSHFGEKDFEFTWIEEKLSEETVHRAQGHDAVCVFVNDDVNANVIEALTTYDIRIVALRCAGYNNVDFKRAYGQVHFVRVPAYSPYAVAEHALALIMTLNRKTHRAYRQTREGDFSIQGLMGMDLHGKTAGVIGTGAIGRIMCTILRGLGMTVLAYDPFPNKEFAANSGVTYVPLNHLYGEADVISLHCPLTKDTDHLIDEDALDRMKNGVFLVNTSRGGLIDSDALIRALKAGKVGAAGLDVYEEESQYFFEDRSDELITDDTLARLLFFPNVLITSHQAFFTREALKNIALTTLRNLREFFSGGYLENEICYRCGSACRKKEHKRCFSLQKTSAEPEE